jgi:hypothetical protein
VKDAGKQGEKIQEMGKIPFLHRAGLGEGFKASGKKKL